MEYKTTLPFYHFIFFCGNKFFSTLLVYLMLRYKNEMEGGFLFYMIREKVATFFISGLNTDYKNTSLS